MARRTRLRDVPALPLLYLLHLVFTLSSLILRLYEALRASITSDSAEREVATENTGGSGAAARARSNAPTHVALVLSTGPNSKSRGSRSRKEAGRLRDAAAESVRRAVTWARNEGIMHLSVYSPDGLLQSLVPEFRSEYEPLPPSPPSSSAGASPSLPPQSHPYLASPPDSVHGDEDQGDAQKPQDEVQHNGEAHLAGPIVTSLRCRGGLQLHILPRREDVTDLIPAITRSFVESGRPADEITQKVIDREVQDRLHSPSPELLLVHPLQPLSLWQSLLPRAAPELHGYPFWPLRITEIYQHPPPLPLHHLEPLFSAARRSTLPFVRKLGSLFQPSDEHELEPAGAEVPTGRQPEQRRRNRIPGALRLEEWEGAMQACNRVEQRLGK